MPEPFDFDAFIRGTSLARRTVGAYRVDHRDAIARLEAEHDATPADAGDERETSTGSTTRHALAERIAALRAEMEASRVEWTLRTLTSEEFRGVMEAKDDEPYEQIALMSRAPDGCANPSLYRDLPNLTADQWRQVSRAIGSAQWGALVSDANSLIVSKVAVPDFSRSVSATLSPPTSSEN